jgi:hypothetical protein
MTSSATEPANFLLVAQRLNQLRHRVPFPHHSDYHIHAIFPLFGD